MKKTLLCSMFTFIALLLFSGITFAQPPEDAKSITKGTDGNYYYNEEEGLIIQAVYEMTEDGPKEIDIEQHVEEMQIPEKNLELQEDEITSSAFPEFNTTSSTTTNYYRFSDGMLREYSGWTNQEVSSKYVRTDYPIKLSNGVLDGWLYAVTRKM